MPLGRADGLDGIRAIAVLAIVAYHLRLCGGGLLGVTVFFTLSGYLITSILVSGRSDLKEFWARRAKRLLPALMLVLVVVLATTAIARPMKLAAYSLQAAAAALYVANWATIAAGDDYFNRFTGAGPFDHLWSLAIEEQFYLVWPLLLLGLLALRRRAIPIVVTALLASGSAWLMVRHYSPAAINHTRAYEGTDTRAAPILIGALAALILPLHAARKIQRTIAVELIGLVSAVVVLVVVMMTDEDSSFLYRGADVLVAIETAALIIAAAHPATVIGRALGVAPLRWLGVRSYGIYLWHMPVVAFMPTTLLGAHPWARASLQLALILTLSALSFALVEDPIRRHGIAPLKRARTWADAISLVAVAAALLVPWSVLSRASASHLDALAVALVTEKPDCNPVELAPPAVPAGLLTSCTELVHVGDSASLAMTFRSYLPAAEDRLEGRYRAVGVRFFTPEISGGRAVVEKINDQPSAYEVVSFKSQTGHKGCWVFAIGMGDSSTVRGSVDALSNRIDWMMRLAAGAPVLWATNKTLLRKGPYQNSYMEGWNEALVLGCARHPNMRVYDWAGEVRDEWYLPDAIHPNVEGARERAKRFAGALAVAFPRDGSWASACVVASAP